jgi:PadR family transcriptional regulator, regulatory protein AphA
VEYYAANYIRILYPMKTKPSTEFALLGTLMSGPMHGYEIMRFINTELGSTWHISTSQLYVLLKKLEKQDLLYSSVELQETRPSKRVFTLSPEGEKIFLRWLHSPTEHARDIRIEFLTKLFFMEHLSIKGASELIDAQIELLGKLQKSIAEREKLEDDPFRKIVCGFKNATVETWIEWLRSKAKHHFETD